MPIPRNQFLTMWNKRCLEVFGTGYSDLPDIINVDDYWHEDLKLPEARSSIDEMEQTMRVEIGF